MAEDPVVLGIRAVAEAFVEAALAVILIMAVMPSAGCQMPLSSL